MSGSCLGVRIKHDLGVDYEAELYEIEPGKVMTDGSSQDGLQWAYSLDNLMELRESGRAPFYLPEKLQRQLTAIRGEGMDLRKEVPIRESFRAASYSLRPGTRNLSNRMPLICSESEGDALSFYSLSTCSPLPDCSNTKNLSRTSARIYRQEEPQQ